jgi:D-glycero-alpha-D-manno-heptose-7-phosphate kinase
VTGDIQQVAARPVTLVRSKAPLRVSFCGGGTDVPPYPADHGGVVLSATINWYAYGTLARTAGDAIEVESVDYGLSARYGQHDDLIYDGKLDLVKSVLRRLCRDRAGLRLYLHSDAPPGSGLGSSSALVVALVGLFNHSRRLGLDEYAVARLAYQIERTDLGIVGGMQDQYAATFGGFNFMEFSADGAVVNRLRIDADVVNELEYSLLLCYTGQTRMSGHIVERQMSAYVAGAADTTVALQSMKLLTLDLKKALLHHRLADFGGLLHDAWEYKKRLDAGISTGQIDELYAAARHKGALGGKVLGAGGGGYLLVYCPFDKKRAIATELERLGGKIAPFGFSPSGIQSWEVQ